MTARNALYVQSGGVTAVINASACGVLERARTHPEKIAKVYAAKDGLFGLLREEFYDTSREHPTQVAALRHTPGGAFGSSRYMLPRPEKDPTVWQRVGEVLRAHDIGYVFVNGGNGSMDTCMLLTRLGEVAGWPVQAIGVPKTIDNDLAMTDCSPGFGSAAKYLATSIREVGLDVKAMEESTKVFILEVMGRHAGWLTLACGLAAEEPGDGPHILLLPEIRFDETRFLAKVRETVANVGHCIIAVSEGLLDKDGKFYAEQQKSEIYGFEQLGGAGPRIAELVRKELKVKCHCAVADYLQRAARHMAARTDVDQAYAVGRAAVGMALGGMSGVMPGIVRISDDPYVWRVDPVPLEGVADLEKLPPREFISEDGFGLTAAARTYLSPLIAGEDYPPFHNGLPAFARLNYVMVEKKLPDFAI
jgi:ATP-dependent phosphofructokinase / diphosphate-dependent phosphofructokinase